MRFDLENQFVYLWDSANVSYQSMKLSAYFIIIDFKNNEVFARGKVDSSGHYAKPEFTDGTDPVSADSMKYNFDTQKAKIWNARREDGEAILIVGAGKKDSTRTMYASKGLYTTCNLEHPHFAIHAGKMKIIPDDKVITGPAYLEVAGIPTPIGIPFGFFPNHKGRASGILIPAPGESPTMGFFLKDGGYYWGISDHMDLALRGDIYSRGSWGAKLTTNYKFRYRSYGSFSGRFSRFIEGDPELPTTSPRNDMQVQWSHSQDPKSNPSIHFSASVNVQSSKYSKFNANRANEYLANTYQSRIAWSKSWRVGTLSANFTHSQNTLTHNVDATVPQLAFAVNRFYPFRGKYSTGSRWFEKIGISAITDFQNTVSAPDSTFLTPSTLDKVRNGLHTSIPLTTTFTARHGFMRFITFAPSVNINSVTQFKTIEKHYTHGILEHDSIYSVNVPGTKAFYEYNAGITMSSKLYLMISDMSVGRLRALLHTMTPSLGFLYRPDFSDPKYGWYRTVQNNDVGGTTSYSIFEGGPYGAPGAGKTGALNFQLLNSLEGKFKAKSDTATQSETKVSLLDALNVGFGYNFMAEHFNWSNVVFSGRSRLFKKVDLSGNVSLDPYRINSEGKRIERLEWLANKRIGRLTSASITAGTSLRKGGLTSQQPKVSDKASLQELEYLNSHPDAYVDFNVPWSLNLNYTLSFSKPGLEQTVTQTIHFSGDLNLTEKWKLGFDSNYDFQKGQFSYTSLNVYRDLHCWDMQFNWIPFGFRQSYNITIKVKSSVLQDLKLTRKRDWYDFTQ